MAQVGRGLEHAGLVEGGPVGTRRSLARLMPQSQRSCSQFYFTSIFTPGSSLHTQGEEWMHHEVLGGGDSLDVVTRSITTVASPHVTCCL